MAGFLTGKKIVVMGVANPRSIAWGCAQAMADQGATVILTYQNARIKKSLERFVPEGFPLVECDVAEDEKVEQAFQEIGRQFTKIDGVLHAIAFADKDTLRNGLVHTTQAGYDLAQNISAYSFISVARYAQPILNNPAGLVTLTYFGSERAIPNYNMMGVAKASLEASVRYLASDLGDDHIRVNAISAGAVKTLAVSGIKHHNELLKLSQENTVDGQSVTTEEIGNVAAFLMSDLATGITGDVIYVDKGVHLM